MTTSSTSAEPVIDVPALPSTPTTPSFQTLVDALDSFADLLAEPVGDPDLDALNAAIRAHPFEETPRLMKIDRLRELGKPLLAQLELLSLHRERVDRHLLDCIAKSLMLPAHLASPATPSRSE